MLKIKALFDYVKQNDKLSTMLCYLFPFLGLGGYLFELIYNNDIKPASGYYLIHYLYTYDNGFIARGLVGEIISWFYDSVSDEITQRVIIVFSFLLMLSTALCIGKALIRIRDNSKLFFIVASLFVLICFLPSSFRYYYYDIKLDKLLWAITLFSVLLVDKKYGIFFVPVLCVIATLVNPVFLFCSMILIAIVLLQEFYANDFSKKMGVICAVSYFLMIVLGIYALISEKYVGFNTPKEMIDYYFSRYDGTLNAETYEMFETEWLFDYFDNMYEIIRKAFLVYFIKAENWRVCLNDLFFLMIPSYTVLGIFWKTCMLESKNKFQKFIFFLCMISPIVIVLPIVFSWETSKYYYNNIIVQIALLIYYIISGNTCVLQSIDKAANWIKQHLVLSICLLSYFVVFIVAY